jgi:CIC family chloride channel protein
VTVEPSPAGSTESPARSGESPPRSAESHVRFALAVAAVAVAAAGFAIVFRALLGGALQLAYHSRDIVSAFRGLPAAARLLLPALGGLLAGLSAHAAAAGGKSQGVGDVMEAIVLGRTQLSMRITLLKSLGSWLAINTGGSIGREGPLIQFGGSLGATLGRWLRIDDERVRVLIAAGTAAGFAAAYNTPLAALLFVLEIMTGVVVLDTVLPVLVATALATALTRAVVGGGPIYGQRTFGVPSPGAYLAHACLGLLAGVAAHVFMRLLSRSEAWLTRGPVPQPWRAGLGGLCVGLLALHVPEITGNGYEPLNALLDGHMATSMVLLLLLAKPLATTASVSSGSPGGVFTPTLLFGAALGACYCHVLASLLGAPALGSTGSYALVGMAAVTAATTHAPLMAAVLVFELSGDYAIVLPLLLATTAATLVARQLRRESLYTAELARLGVSWELTLAGRRVERKPV